LNSQENYTSILDNSRRAQKRLPQTLKISAISKKNFLNLTKSKPTDKLVPHLKKHSNYVLHYTNFKSIVGLGVKARITMVISFKQSSWMKSYVADNRARRAEAKTNKDEFLTAFFKLMNNSVFGKTFETVRNRQNMHLTINRNNAVKWLS
jgi:hypothetical protein